MAGIGDSWGTKEELLHPRGPDGRWIHKAGIAKSIIGAVLDFLAGFKPRQFQSRQQANQYLGNIAQSSGRKRMGRLDHIRLASDLSSTNEDLRDGTIDNPSTQKFVDMMDRSAVELPDDLILTRVVGVDAFGFTPETATGTDAGNPGIRGISGKLVADRGYGLTTIGGPTGTAPAGTVRMVIAAKKGTKVNIPGAGPNDSTVILGRGQPLRVTKVAPDGAGGWIMYATADDSSHDVPEPIGGPVGERPPSPKEREARIRRSAQDIARSEKLPDEEAEAADEARKAEERAKMGAPVPSPTQEAERRRVEQLQPQPTQAQAQQPTAPGVPPPRTEPVVTRSLGGEPRPQTAPGGAPAGQAPGAPEAPAAPRRTVDLRLAVRDAGIPAPAAGPNRKRFNDAYEGVISGKKDPIDAVRELDRDADDLQASGDPDADNLRQLSDVIKKEYGLEQPAAKKKAVPGKAVPRTEAGLPKVERPAPPAAKKAAKEAAPPPVKAPAKKAASSGMTPDQEERVLGRAKEFRGGPRNEEEQRIVDLADEIQARRTGTPVKKVAPVKAAPVVPEGATTPEQEIKGLFNGKRPTNAQLREMGERNNLGFGPKEPRSEMILAILGARPRRGQQVGEVPVPAKKASTSDRVADLLLERMRPDIRDQILADMPEKDRREVEAARLRVQAAKKAPAKAPAKKAAPVKVAFKTANLPPNTRREYGDLSPEEQREYVKLRRQGANHSEALQSARDAVSARVTGGDLDKMTKAELLAESERRGVVTPKSWTKDKIKAHLRDQETHAPVKKTPEQRREQRRTDQDLAQEFERRKAQGEGEPQPSTEGPMRIGEARRRTALDAVQENQVPEEPGAWKNIQRNLESGNWTVARARKEAKESARHWREGASTIRRAGTTGTPEGREKAASRVERVADKYDKLAEALTESQSVIKTDKYTKGAKNDAPAAPFNAGNKAEEVSSAMTGAPGRERVEQGVRAMDGLNLPQLRQVAKELGIGVPGRDRDESKTPEALREFIARNLDSFGTPGTPPTLAPAKKAAVPGAAPGTAAGKITAGRLTPGMRILVGPDDGHTTRKTGSKVATITSVDRIGTSGRTRSQTRIQIQATDEDGRTFIVGQGTAVMRDDRVGFSPSQTFMVAPEPGAAPAKKVAPSARGGAPNPDTIRQQLVSMPADQHFPFIEDTLQPLNLTQSRALAKSLGVRGQGRAEKPNITQAIVTHFEGAGDTEAIARLKSPDLEETARTRQATIDRARHYGRLGAEIEELINAEVEPDVLARGILRVGRGLPPEDLDLLARAAQVGNPGEVRFHLGKLLDDQGVNLHDHPGSIERYDPRRHQSLSGDLPEGTMVRVVRPGSETRIDGEFLHMDKSVVEVATPQETVRMERARRLVPEGSVPGDRTSTPVDNEPRKRTLDEAWKAAGISSEGSPGRSMEEIHKDISSGKLTPEEGIRRMEEEIAFNKEDLAEVDATLRQPDLTPEQIARFQSDAAKLQAGIDAQTKASKFLRLYFKDEKPTVKEVEVSLDAEGFRAIQAATPESLRQVAKEQGLDAPKGETKDEILQDLIRQMAGKVIRDKGIKKAAPKKAAKKVAPEAPKISPDREKLDAKVIGTGIEFGDDKWTQDVLADVQRALDGEDVGFGLGKNPTPAAIGRHLDERANSHMTTAVYAHGAWHTSGDKLVSLEAEDKAKLAAEHEAAYAKFKEESAKIRELAERLKATRRKPAKKAPAKAAPEVKAAEAKVDNLEARIINDHLERVSKARSRQQGNAELEGLTMLELRRVGASMGIKGRSKKEMRDGILDRFFPEVQTPEAKAEVEGQQKQALDRLRRQGAPSVPATKGLSARAREAGIEQPIQMFSGVDSGVGEADRRLKAGQSPTEVARFLRERAAEVSKADLNEEGRRFTTIQDKDTLKAIRKQSAEYLRRVGTHVQQEGKATKATPAKKAAPAAPAVPSAPSPSRTGTSPVGGTKSTAPELKNDWGKLGTGGDVEFHDDGVVGSGLRSMGEDRLLDVDGEPLSNVVGKLATRAIRGQISQEQLLDNLRRLEQRLPEGSRARRGVASMIEGIDAPKRAMPDLPEGTPAPFRTAMEGLLKIPLTREAVNRPGFHRSREDSEVDKLLKMIQEFQEGRTGGLRMIMDIQDMRNNLPHESQEGRFEADRVLRQLHDALQALYNDKDTRSQVMRRQSAGT